MWEHHFIVEGNSHNQYFSHIISCGQKQCDYFIILSIMTSTFYGLPESGSPKISNLEG